VDQVADELRLLPLEVNHYTQHSDTECSEGSREGSFASVLVVLGVPNIKAAARQEKHCKNASLAVGMERSERNK
jgi:hypothetical protein